jgi:orotate phosphoribosyltransferase-like protein
MNKHPISDERLVEFVTALDDVIKQFEDFEAHNIVGVLLSRVTLLMTMEPELGKQLLKYVWEQLDAIESADPGSMIP